MIIVVSLNPSVDWLYSVPKFLYGGLNRVKLVCQDIAGKGINVAVALKNLKINPIYMGFNFIENGNLLTDKLTKEQIEHDLVTVPGAIRVNIKLYEENTMTELNQLGDTVSAQVVQNLFDKIKQSIWNVEKNILILTGSCPQGVKDDFYARICENWAGKVILDTEGESLMLAIESQKPPYAIKPNLYELQKTFGLKNTEPKEIALFCKDLLKKYTKLNLICVSLGAEGAIWATQSSALYCPAFEVNVKSVHGAGDSMVAALAYGLLQKNTSETMLFSHVMSAATATVIHDGTNMCTLEGFKEILNSQPHLSFKNILD